VERSAVNYRVVWRLQVRRNIDVRAFLARETGRDPDRLLRAVEEIELRLSFAPLAEGESRGASERVLIVHPLSVQYEVFESERVVLIYSAIFYPRLRL
jgi:hypothetical protein